MEAAAGALLEEKVHKMDNMPTLGAEDFAFFLQAVPGCYFFVGNGLDSEYLHNEKYDFRDENIEVAASVFVQVAKHYCGR
ncbi:M20/M25/M40 family metallo-hydrolase [Taylorella asinigenitalis]|uniref:M20/M25/M40 family metallo-hydrolase n=1 Tax=Taylorella asinigenitalis TaxID=84590 RepID=UPI00048E2921|nr:M20/M25/M40 family metallo-hydrolase [Taylorella asinigenitalis]